MTTKRAKPDVKITVTGQHVAEPIASKNLSITCTVNRKTGVQEVQLDVPVHFDITPQELAALTRPGEGNRPMGWDVVVTISNQPEQDLELAWELFKRVVELRTGESLVKPEPLLHPITMLRWTPHLKVFIQSMFVKAVSENPKAT